MNDELDDAALIACDGALYLGSRERHRSDFISADPRGLKAAIILSILSCLSSIGFEAAVIAMMVTYHFPLLSGYIVGTLLIFVMSTLYLIKVYLKKRGYSQFLLENVHCVAIGYLLIVISVLSISDAIIGFINNQELKGSQPLVLLFALGTSLSFAFAVYKFYLSSWVRDESILLSGLVSLLCMFLQLIQLLSFLLVFWNKGSWYLRELFLCMFSTCSLCYGYIIFYDHVHSPHI